MFISRKSNFTCLRKFLEAKIQASKYYNLIVILGSLLIFQVCVKLLEREKKQNKKKTISILKISSMGDSKKGAEAGRILKRTLWNKNSSE